MKNVSLLIVATNKYTDFLPALLKSVDRFFLRDSQVTVHLFTNMVYQTECFKGVFPVQIHEIPHHPFPFPTLYRYHFFEKYLNDIMFGGAADYIFYIDADTVITEDITEQEVLYDSVGTQHCGYVGRRGTYESRRESSCYVPPGDGNVYFGGGFWGFSRGRFPEFIRSAVVMVDADALNGIVPEWHDESVLNKYFVDNHPEKILSPSFHYPESDIDRYREMWGQDYPCKIKLLDKDKKIYHS